MSWFQKLLAALFKRKSTQWDEANYGKPSNAGDDFRNNNNV